MPNKLVLSVYQHCVECGEVVNRNHRIAYSIVRIGQGPGLRSVRAVLHDHSIRLDSPTNR